MNNSWTFSSILRGLMVVLLLIGIFFRFSNLDRKVYWHDETYTSLRISGYTSKEVSQQIFDGRVIGFEDLQKYQRPNSEKSLVDVINGLAIDDPQHPPLYYVLVRWWVQIFGNSVTAIRCFSALISLLIFPAVYWLCSELFLTRMVGRIAVGMMAISPFNLVYAQEAREYVLWSVTILLSSAALLQAIRLKTKLNWLIYAVTLALGFYSFILTGLVAAGHGIYVVLTEKFRLTQTVKFYFLASLVAIIAFLPWIFVLITNYTQFQATTGWTGNIKVSWVTLVQAWAIHLIRIFADFDLGFEHPFTYFILPFVLGLIGYSIYWVIRQTPRRIWLFIIVCMTATALPMMLPDLIFGGVRSASHRYLLPSFLAIQLSIAYLLANKMSDHRFYRQKLGQIITVLVISVGVVSCAVNSQSDTWWNKLLSYNIPKVARIINEANSPLVVSNFFATNPGNIFSLSYLLEPKVKFQVVVDPNVPQIPAGFNDVFLFNPPERLKSAVEQQLKAKAEYVFGDDYIQVLKLSVQQTNIS